ncbi:DUF6511 domain-containing protein [Sphingobium indicum]|nr:DUF6511 domain-containing protein [Sphingobium indicum]
MKLTEMEQQAVIATLPGLGVYVAGIGMEKGLAEYSKDEVLGLIATCVKEFRTQLHEIIGEEVPF